MIPRTMRAVCAGGLAALLIGACGDDGSGDASATSSATSSASTDSTGTGDDGSSLDSPGGATTPPVTTTGEPPAGSSSRGSVDTGDASSTSGDASGPSGDASGSSDGDSGESEVLCRPGLIPDGSFENGTPSPAWAEASTTYGSPLCDLVICGFPGFIPTRSGSWWAWFGYSFEEVEEASLEQRVVIGEDIQTMRFWVSIPYVDPACTGEFRAIIDDQVLFEIDDQAPGYEDYVEVSVDVTDFADGAEHRIRFEIITLNGEGAVDPTSFFLDDVTLCSDRQ